MAGSKHLPDRAFHGSVAVLVHGAAVAFDKFLVGVDAAQLQHGVAHGSFDQHGNVAPGHHLDHHLEHRHAQHVLGQRLIGIYSKKGLKGLLCVR